MVPKISAAFWFPVKTRLKSFEVSSRVEQTSTWMLSPRVFVNLLLSSPCMQSYRYQVLCSVEPKPIFWVRSHTQTERFVSARRYGGQNCSHRKNYQCNQNHHELFGREGCRWQDKMLYSQLWSNYGRYQRTSRYWNWLQYADFWVSSRVYWLIYFSGFLTT